MTKKLGDLLEKEPIPNRIWFMMVGVIVGFILLDISAIIYDVWSVAQKLAAIGFATIFEVFILGLWIAAIEDARRER